MRNILFFFNKKTLLCFLLDEIFKCFLIFLVFITHSIKLHERPTKLFASDLRHGDDTHSRLLATAKLQT